MKLYLSSDRTGCCPEVFAGWAGALRVGGGGRVAVIGNALDLVPEEARAAYVRDVFDPLAHFANLGLKAEWLDLRGWFGRPDDLQAALAGIDALWLTGGETFLLMRAIRASGLDREIARRRAAGTLVYGGWSAGAMAAAPTLEGVALMDRADARGEGYPPGETPREGLGLIGEQLVVHYRSDHAEGPAADRMAAFYEAHGMAFTALGEGDVLLMDGDRREVRRAGGA